MGPVGPAGNATAPGPTNVVVLSKIPEGVTESQLTGAAGGIGAVLSVSYREADPDGPGWAIVAFANPELAKLACERLDGKPLQGLTIPLDASLGEGLYGPIRRGDDALGDGPWKEARTPLGQLYYYHVISRQASWAKPAMDFTPGPPPGIPPGATGGRSIVPPPPAGPPPPGSRPAFIPGAPGGQPPPPSGHPAAAAAAAQLAAASQHNLATMQAQAEGGGTGGSSAGPSGANLFVYHIPNSWDDGIMRQHFEPFGAIISCRVQKDADGRPRGFGFVSFKEPASATASIAGMHGFPVDGKHLKVQHKKGEGDNQVPPPPGGAPPPPPPSGGYAAIRAPPPPGMTPSAPY